MLIFYELSVSTLFLRGILLNFLSFARFFAIKSGKKILIFCLFFDLNKVSNFLFLYEKDGDFSFSVLYFSEHCGYSQNNRNATFHYMLR